MNLRALVIEAQEVVSGGNIFVGYRMLRGRKRRKRIPKAASHSPPVSRSNGEISGTISECVLEIPGYVPQLTLDFQEHVYLLNVWFVLLFTIHMGG